MFVKVSASKFALFASEQANRRIVRNVGMSPTRNSREDGVSIYKATVVLAVRKRGIFRCRFSGTMNGGVKFLQKSPCATVHVRLVSVLRGCKSPTEDDIPALVAARSGLKRGPGHQNYRAEVLARV